MDFIDKIKQLSQTAQGLIDTIQTEEATKTAIIMPFLNALGYNVFDPNEVTPEFIADLGTKKGEKIDYAILKNGTPTILIECKWCGIDLNEVHASQLYRYFSVTQARIGILTNGTSFHFFADLEEKNKMDDKPFFVFDLFSFDESSVKELQKFSKAAFDTDIILPAASELKYTGEIKKVLADQLIEPDDDFIRYFASKVYSGRLGKNVMKDFSIIVKKAFSQFIRDRINDRLTAALSDEKVEQSDFSPETTAPVEEENDGIVTTQEEIDAFNIVRAICSEIVDASRVTMKDSKTYCGLFFDNHSRKPICRLRFNSSKNYIGLFDEEKNEEKILLEKMSDIFKVADKIKDTLRRYL